MDPLVEVVLFGGSDGSTRRQKALGCGAMNQWPDVAGVDVKHLLLTTIERLDADHPGLLTAVRMWFDKGISCEKISALLLANYQVQVKPSTVGHYRSTRWKPEKENTRECRITFKALTEARSDKDLDEAAKARLWELLKTMSPMQVIAVRRLGVEFDRRDIAQKHLENETRELEAKLTQAQRKNTSGKGRRARPRAAEDAVPGTEPGQVVERIREIFGIGPPDDRAIEPSGQPPTPPVPAPEGSQGA